MQQGQKQASETLGTVGIAGRARPGGRPRHGRCRPAPARRRPRPCRRRRSDGAAARCRSRGRRRRPEAQALAIPDYDSLSASQVVPRLDGLSHRRSSRRCAPTRRPTGAARRSSTGSPSSRPASEPVEAAAAGRRRPTCPGWPSWPARGIAELRADQGRRAVGPARGAAEPVEDSLAAALARPATAACWPARSTTWSSATPAVRTEELRDGGRAGGARRPLRRARGPGRRRRRGDDGRRSLAWARAQGCVGVDALALPGNRETKNFFETLRPGGRGRSSCTGRSARWMSRRPELCVGAVVVDDGPAAAGPPRARPGGGRVVGARRPGRAGRDARRGGRARAARGDRPRGRVRRSCVGWVERIGRRPPLRDPRLRGDRARRRPSRSPATTPPRRRGCRSTRWPSCDLVDGLAEFLHEHGIIDVIVLTATVSGPSTAGGRFSMKAVRPSVKSSVADHRRPCPRPTASSRPRRRRPAPRARPCGSRARRAARWRRCGSASVVRRVERLPGLAQLVHQAEVRGPARRRSGRR